MSWKLAVAEILSEKLETKILVKSVSSVGGGSINDAFRFATTSGDFFVKKNVASRYPEMFEKEAKGLKILAAANEIDVPEVLTTTTRENQSFLILDFIQSAPKQHNFWEDFGERLANLHKLSQENFGLDHGNYIGSLQQENNFHNTWSDFFREERLEVQVKLARDQGQIGRETVNGFNRFYGRLEEIFPIEPPALLHGDLWSGNFMVNNKGLAVIIDPAVYFGHREMDLAMSQLFGGFDERFYQAYNRSFPLENGWQQRMDYCNLYPLMVHVNLFGGSYLASVKRILSKF